MSLFTKSKALSAADCLLTAALEGLPVAFLIGTVAEYDRFSEVPWIRTMAFYLVALFVCGFLRAGTRSFFDMVNPKAKTVPSA